MGFIKNLIPLIVVGLVLFWAWLFLSGKGVLIKAEEGDGALVTTLECTYFTGVGTVQQTHLKSELTAIGKQVCPRLVQVD